MDQVFLQILNTALTAGWLVLAVILARLLLKKAPAWIKCALWAIVALRLVWPFSIESVLSLLPSAETIPPSQLYAYAPQVNTGISSLNTAINPVFTETFRSEPLGSVNPLQAALWVAGYVWVLGMVAMAAYAAISYLRIRRRVRVSIPEGEGVYLCDQIPAPFILGIIRPKIYLPADLPREKWDSILANERAHLARLDHWWKPLGFLLLAVFWFHPLLWVAYVLLCRDVELACDERVIKSLSAEEKRDYSNTLLECSIPGRWITACPLAFGETGVKQRVKAVLHYKKPTLWILIIALIACTVLTVGFLTEPSEAAKENTKDVAGKQYVYVGEGAGSVFYINIYKDGTFQYYAGLYSSHIGLGDWEMKDGKLYLHDATLSNPMTFVFTVADNALVYLAEESYPFMYVNVKDGDVFRYHATISQPGSTGDVPGPAQAWHRIHQVIGLETGEFRLEAFREDTFRWGDGKIEMVHGGAATALVKNATIYNLGAVDLNKDGYPELCATVSTESKGEHVIIFDIANEESYTLWDPDGAYIYHLYTEYVNGGYYVMCAKDDAQTGKAIQAGRLIFADDKTPAIKEPTLHTLSGDAVTVVYDQNHPDSAHQGQLELDGFPGVSIRWYYSPNVIGSERPVIVKNGEETALFEGFPAPMSLYLADVTGDGKLDLCANVYYFYSGFPSYNAVCVYDYAQDCYYMLADRESTNYYTKLSYYLRVEDGKLLCDKITVAEDSVLETGTLHLQDTGMVKLLCMRPLLTYDTPRSYTYKGADQYKVVTLSLIHEGSCKMYFTHKSFNHGGTGSWLFGTYYITGNTLYFHTEDQAVYVFRVAGEELVFVAELSSELPEHCALYDGAVLKSNPLNE